MANTTWHKRFYNKNINTIGINNKLKSYIKTMSRLRAPGLAQERENSCFHCGPLCGSMTRRGNICICMFAVLSMEENATGRFLKANSGQDKTRAGKMMAAVGKSQSFAAQQRYTTHYHHKYL